MPSVPDLYLVIDGKRGLGHRMRTWAIAEEWLAHKGIVHWGWEDMPANRCVVVFDGYDYTDDQRQKWMRDGHLVVTMDDFPRQDFDTHVLINTNYGMSVNHPAFSTPRKAKRVLLGTFFFPLRSHYKRTKRRDAGYAFDADRAERAMPPDEFAQKMAQARFVITSAGITAYEAMYLGKPLLLRRRADNQSVTYDGLINDGLALPDGEKTRLLFGKSREARKTFSEATRGLVDGNGAGRIVSALLEEFAWLH